MILPDSIPHDCKWHVCDGHGNILVRPAEHDRPPEDDLSCVEQMCEGWTAIFGPETAGAKCKMQGGPDGVCDGNRQCVACVHDTDRGVGSDRSASYTLIFEDGIAYYTAAPLDKQHERYTELKKRLIANLPETDSARTDTVVAIDQGLADFTTATTALGTARTNEAMASTKLDASEEAWDRLMEKVYGTLVAELGRPAAERFFPRRRSRKKKKSSTEEPT